MATRGNGGTIAANAHPEAAANALAGPVSTGFTVSAPSRRDRRSRIRRWLAISDVTALILAFLVTFAGVSGGTPVGSPRFSAEAALFILTLPLWLVFGKSLDLYTRDDARADHSTADEAIGVISLVTVGTWIVFVSAWATDLSHPQVPRLVGFWALALTLLLTGRVIVRTLAKRTAEYVQRSVVLGAGHVGQLIARKIQQHPEYGIEIVGFVDEDPRIRRAEVDHLPVLGGLQELDGFVSAYAIDRVIVAFSGKDDAGTMQLVRSLRDQNVIVDVVPRLYELVGPRADIHLVEGMPLLTIPPARLSRTSLIAKRFVDLMGAGLLLIITSPVFIVAAIQIKRESHGPIFFRQTRLGLNQHPFTALKFRTMKVGTDIIEHREYIKSTMTANAQMNANGTYKLDREADVTPFGRLLRKTSLDELPQLINILRGDMSLVGPRPCIEYETEFFEPHHYDRFLVPQGLTGLWQVTARANSTFGEALEMDVAYVRGWSLGLDLRLLFRTPFAILRQRKATR